MTPRHEFFRKIMCGLRGVKANLVSHRVILIVPPGHVTHMSGAIAFARLIDPKVVEIIATPETAPPEYDKVCFYSLEGGKWVYYKKTFGQLNV